MYYFESITIAIEVLISAVRLKHIQHFFYFAVRLKMYNFNKNKVKENKKETAEE